MDEISQGLKRFHDGCLGVPRIALVDINVIGAKAPQAILTPFAMCSE